MDKGDNLISAFISASFLPFLVKVEDLLDLVHVYKNKFIVVKEFASFMFLSKDHKNKIFTKIIQSIISNRVIFKQFKSGTF